MATSAVAAAVARARRNIQHQFFSHDAVRADRAIPFEPSRHIERRQFERMKNRGIIHETKPGLYWLNVVAYDVDLTARYHRVRIALWVVLFLLVAALVIPLIQH